jgi:hypothetical protein
VSGHQELSRIVQLIQAKSFKQAQHACLNYQKLHGLDFNVLTCLSTLAVQENNLLKSREYLQPRTHFDSEQVRRLQSKTGI